MKVNSTIFIVLVIFTAQLYSKKLKTVKMNKLVKSTQDQETQDDYDEPLDINTEMALINGDLTNGIGFEFDYLNYVDSLFEEEPTESDIPQLEFEKCYEKLNVNFSKMTQDEYNIELDLCDRMKVEECKDLSDYQKGLYLDCMELEAQNKADAKCAGSKFNELGCPGYVPLDICAKLTDDKLFIKCINDFCDNLEVKDNVFCIDFEKNKKKDELELFCSQDDYKNWGLEQCPGFVPNVCKSASYDGKLCEQFCFDKRERLEYSEYCKYLEMKNIQDPKCSKDSKEKGCIDESPLDLPEFSLKSKSPQDIKDWNSKILNWCKVDKRDLTSFVCYTMLGQAKALKDAQKDVERLKVLDRLI